MHTNQPILRSEYKNLYHVNRSIQKVKNHNWSQKQIESTGNKKKDLI